MSFGLIEFKDGCASDDVKDIQQSVLFDRADEALYKAKQNGRNRVECWSDSNNIKYDYKDNFTFMKSPTKPKGNYTNTGENIGSIVENFREKLNSENLERIVLFVFGITGSGKDTLLNHLYSQGQ